MQRANFHLSKTVQGVGENNYGEGKERQYSGNNSKDTYCDAFEMESDCALLMPKIACRQLFLEFYKVEKKIMINMHVNKNVCI